MVAVPQEVKLLNATLAENIAMSSLLDDLLAVESFCKETGFELFFNKLPLGLLTPVGEDGVNLSGGQRQLLGLCRTLFRKPEVLLLDEPTASLDRKASLFVRELMGKLIPDTAILMVTHLPELMSEADVVYRLRGQKLELLSKIDKQEWSDYRIHTEKLTNNFY